MSNFVVPGLRSLARTSIPRFAIGITNGPMPQHKSITLESGSIKSAMILCSSCNLEFQYVSPEQQNCHSGWHRLIRGFSALLKLKKIIKDMCQRKHVPWLLMNYL